MLLFFLFLDRGQPLIVESGELIGLDQVKYLTTLMAGKIERRGTNLDTSTEIQVACHGLFVAHCPKFLGSWVLGVVQVL